MAAIQPGKASLMEPRVPGGGTASMRVVRGAQITLGSGHGVFPALVPQALLRV